MQTRREEFTAESGLTLIEVLVASSLMLVLLMAMYDVFDSSNRLWVQGSDNVNARATGRAALELMGAEIRGAGYSPLAGPIDGIQAGDAFYLHVVSDLDEDGVIGTHGEVDENITWSFELAGDVYRLVRGVDYNGNRDFHGTNETFEVIATDIVQIDVDEDGINDPLITYDLQPPNSNRVRISFGIRNQHRDMVSNSYEITEFDSEFKLRNRCCD